MIDPHQTDKGLLHHRNVIRPSNSVDDGGQPKEVEMKASVFMHQPECHPTLAMAQVVGAVFGLSGSVGVGLLGAALTAIGRFVANEAAQHLFTVIGSVLLFLTIPLIILAACCLDGLEKDKPQRRLKAVQCDKDEDDDYE